MRIIHTDEIKKVVSELCKKACYVITPDMKEAFIKATQTETSPLAKDILFKLLQNSELAEKKVAPICQDTGMTVVFLEIGQDVRIEGEYIEDAVNAGVADGYVGGYLRKSVVAEPLFERKNTTNNTPAVINTKIVPGDKIKIKVAPKGFGSENKSILKMLVPADGIEGVKKVFLDAVKLAGPNACPPMVIGVGIGGTMDKAALLSKHAAVRSIDSKNSDERYAKLEEELLELARKTGVGPQGLGGDTTAVKVNIEWYPTHIAGLPVAININCHAARHADAEI
ncbi:tartrate dehydratase/fumarate hydratase, alpha subunit [Campylobacter pinnipediorum subsp. caledonicus]|uniref:Tartrate dehydratase/fumarate hydratase, alpha subunit n=1 Tax=Campylobacter pinnipediorum subsp. caledonicus TaxID=1874362 RepID=A0A1S6U5C2_9BACT|nr:fumarate hydratase [Campylobacter pinnipediorum]AQW85337.1 tartrate dehydratase/fumarate hydratase, alpha subunit [Campylobacter pinnipediorum subsp. caledonicus]AQW86946.1 tartrate dehydratase/fumarate hydratase, alpha subunit [Campylobacter pinnipediorum subsp. caledonicus]OPA71937.1 fumarate hydratase [Campylobacter pinnipediorum subsp. caledonicus]